MLIIRKFHVDCRHYHVKVDRRQKHSGLSFLPPIDLHIVMPTVVDIMLALCFASIATIIPKVRKTRKAYHNDRTVEDGKRKLLLVQSKHYHMKVDQRKKSSAQIFLPPIDFQILALTLVDIMQALCVASTGTGVLVLISACS